MGVLMPFRVHDPIVLDPPGQVHHLGFEVVDVERVADLGPGIAEEGGRPGQRDPEAGNQEQPEQGSHGGSVRPGRDSGRDQGHPPGPARRSFATSRGMCRNNRPSVPSGW